jgi:hypothetical protein
MNHGITLFRYATYRVEESLDLWTYFSSRNKVRHFLNAGAMPTGLYMQALREDLKTPGNFLYTSPGGPHDA